MQRRYRLNNLAIGGLYEIASMRRFTDGLVSTKGLSRSDCSNFCNVFAFFLFYAMKIFNFLQSASIPFTV